MKKILTILALAGSVTLGYSQGLVTFSTISGTYAMSTNSMPSPGIGGVVGKAGTAANGYYYALLTQTYTGAASSTINANPLTGWTFSGAMATNSPAIAGGVAGGTATIAGWTPGTTEYVEVVGWSANLGTTWAQVSSELQSGNWTASGFFGNSVVGDIASGGAGSPAGPSNPLFTPTGIGSGFEMFATVPEPTTVALIGLGGLGLAMIRRRK
jgi:hypothetical protein